MFGSDLPYINSNATPLQIADWKQNSAVKKCFKKLFHKVSNGEPETYMTRIINKVWKDKKNTPKIKIAYTISICEALLNPEIHQVQMSEKLIKPKIRKNLVGFKIAM